MPAAVEEPDGFEPGRRKRSLSTAAPEGDPPSFQEQKGHGLLSSLTLDRSGSAHGVGGGLEKTA
jgi:hypothetical protein